MSQATDFIEYVLENIVSQPDQLKLNEIEGPEESIIEVRVADEDVGKVIGKSGSVARALRNVVNAIGLKDDANYSVEIID
ncbi:MAG: RNA-binding protein [Spirochaetaceae bacterium]|nr:RNA-binding protein [Spirochaetaceae bacterium]|tara:strand:+ start:79185 stop:79424 length:240 start_codon:yes stop_codon:yes gene_type:complete